MTVGTSKPVKRNDAYTGLLAISFLAMAGGCVLLYLEYQQYENRTPPALPKIDVPGTVRPAPAAPKEIPKEIPKEKEPEPMPMEKEKEKEKMMQAPVPPIERTSASSPMSEVLVLPGGELMLPAPPASAIIPAAGTVEIPTPIIQAGAIETPTREPAKIPLPSMPEPVLDDAPPLKVKPFIPPMQ